MRLFGPGFPWGTMAVNIIGSFVMGVFIETLVRRTGMPNELRLFVATGILGRLHDFFRLLARFCRALGARRYGFGAFLCPCQRRVRDYGPVSGIVARKKPWLMLLRPIERTVERWQA